VDILASALSDNDEQPQQEAPEQEAPQVEQQQVTGEHQEASPAETQEAPEEAKQAHGLQAALIAERRRRQELENLIRQQQQQQQAKPQAAGAPNPDDFQDNPQEYWRQLARHEAREELRAAVEQAQAAQKAQAEQARINQTHDALAARVAAGQGKYRDFDAVINGGLAPFLTDSLREEIASSDVGDDVAYWLGKNPAEAQRLASLSARELARAFVKLEAKAVKPPAPSLPQTLTQARDARGQYQTAGYDGPTPLDAVLSRKT
jgi:hypothetical protein